MRRACACATLLLVACGPLVDPRDTRPAEPSSIVGELHVDDLEGTSKLVLGRNWTAWPMAVGDLDGDGIDDIVVVQRHANGQQHPTAHVFLGAQTTLPRDLRLTDADLSFGFGDDFDRFLQVIAAGDLDGDGRDDLAVHHGPTLSLLRWRDLHEGVLAVDDAPREIDTGALAPGQAVLAPGDLDGDGMADLWLDLYDEDRMTGSMFFGGAADFFDPDAPPQAAVAVARPPIGERDYLSARVFEDVDGDGRPEALVEVSAADRIDILDVDALIAGESPSPLASLRLESHWGALPRGGMDFNGDGIRDIPLAASDPGVAVLLGHAAPLDPAPALRGYSVTAREFESPGDVDGDGFDDLLVHVYDVSGRGWMHVFYGNANGDLLQPGATVWMRDDLGQGLDPIGIGDFNADGFDDFILSYGFFSGQASNEDNAYLYVVYGAPR